VPEKTLRSAAVTATAQPHRPFDMVCEGGGVKGIGLAGAYSVLEEQGYGAVNLAGTSAGAITAALIAAGCGTS
jgi:predicted acylesterase/phospholipase RssA